MDGNAADSRDCLTPDELNFCVRACAYLRLPATPPDYFGDYLVDLAKDERPRLAAKLRRQSRRDLAELYEYVHDLQRLVR